MIPPRILIIGAEGQVAWELQRTLATLGEVIAAGRNSQPYRLNLSNPDSLGSAITAIRPNLIVNAAAYTAVDKAESEIKAATLVNAESVGVIAFTANKLGIPLVHYSTDYVFDGTSSTPYSEDMKPNPQSVYGRSKLGGEAAIQGMGGAHLILRTCWVYGTRGSNFLHTIRRLARERTELRIVADQHGSPTWSRHIAEATAQIIAKLGFDPAAWQPVSGIYHVASAGEATWFDFADRIVVHQRAHETVTCQHLVPITTADYPTPAQRPSYSVLNCEKLALTFGIHMPHWEDALNQVQDDLNSAVI